MAIGNSYLDPRTHWTGSSVSQDIQLGAQIYQQSQQEKRMQRAQQMQEEVRRLALEEKERVAEGTVEVLRVLSDMGKSGGYTDPALQGRFFDAVSNHPTFAGTPAFKDIMNNFQYAEQAKARKELLGQTYEFKGDAAEQRHLFRLDEIDAQLEKALATENLSQENRERLEGIRHNNRQEIIRLRPTRSGQLIHDLTETDLVNLRSELTTIDNLFKEGKITGTKKPGVFSTGYSETPVAEYERRKQEVRSKYDTKRIETPKSAEAVTSGPPKPVSKEEYDKLPVGTRYIAPDGKEYTKK